MRVYSRYSQYDYQRWTVSIGDRGSNRRSAIYRMERSVTRPGVARVSIGRKKASASPVELCCAGGSGIYLAAGKYRRISNRDGVHVAHVNIRPDVILSRRTLLVIAAR